MELDERKQKILEAIIHNYMESGEPVGSRTVSKFTDLNLSSATIRNEMSLLEDFGLLEKTDINLAEVEVFESGLEYLDGKYLVVLDTDDEVIGFIHGVQSI